MLHLVIPTRNEAPYIQSAIRRLVRSLADLTVPWQIIVADNGSTDGTGETVEKLRITNYPDTTRNNKLIGIPTEYISSRECRDELRDKVRLLNCPKEGKGAAISYSASQLPIINNQLPITNYELKIPDKKDAKYVRDARSRHSQKIIRSVGIPIVVSGYVMDVFFGFIDADLSADPDAIPGMLEKLQSDEADLVIGSRLLNVKTTNRGWLRTVASKLFNWLTALMLGLKVKDAQCGLKLMNARGLEVLKQCQEPGWFLDIELLARARQQGLRILEVPVVWTEFRFPGRKSQIKHIQDGLEAVRAMWRVRRRLHN